MTRDVVLIHSTGQGAAGWERVVRALGERGQTAHAVELMSDPGLLAAWVPDPEASFVEDTNRHLRAAFHPDWIGKDPTEDDAVAAAFLYHDTDEATLEWALSTRRLFLPLGVFGQRLPLAPEIPSTYIVAAHDRTIRPEWQRRMARERLGVEPVELASGHCPNVSQPDRLAALLVEVANARDVDTRPPARQPPRRKGRF